ncbi:MAG TPA: DUF748 domain-containing protein [Deltaproteobacteria bacterium]|nr:DUF748 domain-containing protein [Deltaproteobacteria bacterium]
MPTTKKILIGTVVFLLFYSIAGFYILPAAIRPVLEKKLSQALKRTVIIEDIDTNPYTLSARIKWLRVKDLAGNEIFSSFDELYVNLQASSALKRALILKEIRLEMPYVRIIHEETGQFNFSDLMQPSTSPEAADKEPVHFYLGNIQVTGGRIDLIDAPMNTNHQIEEIQVRLPFLSNIGLHAGVFVQPYLGAVINGTRAAIKGQTKPFHDSLETVFTINLTGIDIPYYMGYLPQEVQIRVPSGSLDLSAEVSYAQRTDRTPSLKCSGSIELSDLKITDAKDLDILDIARARIDIAQSRVLEKEIHVSDIDLASPEVTLRRGNKGEINVASIVEEKPQQPDIPEQDTEKTPLILRIDRIGMKDGIVTFTDESAAEPVSLTLDNIRFSLKDFSSAGDKPGTAETALRINRKGSVSAKATFETSPLSCEALIRMDGLEPSWVQPYFTDQIRIMITKGSALADGTLTLRRDTGNQVQIGFKGTAALNDFASVDKENTDEFISWKNLSFTGMDMGFSPVRIAVEEIALDDLSAHIIVDPEGDLNLNTVFKKPQEKEPAPEKEGSSGSEDIQIEKVALRNATVSFIDRHIDPYFSTELANINGSVTGLTSMGRKPASVEVSGTLDKASPLEIKGTVDPLADDLFADLHTSFRDIDLSPASPYAGRYIGSTIQKGKLSLDLTYFIQDRHLDSKNEVFIDQLTFGEGVDSPDALDLPVEFAVSLLKDPGGRISLDLPVTGRTDDPEFSVGKVVFQILTNIVKKAATSPFSLLSSLYPGAENLSYVEFDHGISKIASSEQEKFDLLIQILRDKPTITLEITGYADRETDRSGLVQYFFEKKLKSRKLMGLIRKGQSAVSVDEVVIAADEYEEYLRLAYKAETFDKPKNALGLDASIPAQQMEMLMKGHIQVTENDLRLLASQRAQQVKNYLIQSQQINPDRIFLVEAASPLAPESIDGVSGSRAALSLE